MSKPKLFVVGNNLSYAGYFLTDYLPVQFQLTDKAANADFALFTGGADISPALYGEQPHRTTSFSVARDTIEVNAFKFFQESKIPMLGICRGHQLFAALSGAKLYQDVDNHAGGMHQIICNLNDGDDDTIMDIPSAHHQAVDPKTIGKNWEIWAKAFNSLSTRRHRNNTVTNTDKSEIEIEGLYIPETLCLGIQGHPEWLDENSPSVAYWLNTVKHYFL